MAAVPRYNIIPCCPDSGTQITNFHIPDGPVPNGVYIYNGTTFAQPVNGVSFQNGQCYTIQVVDTNFASYPEAPSYNDFTLVSNCSDEQCIACEPLFEREIIRFTSCCDDTDFLEFIYDGTTDYGTLVKPTTLFPGFSDSCYRVNTYLGSNWVGLGPAPSLAYFTVITTDPEAKCTDPEYQEICDCQPKCYTLINCDGVSFPSTNPFLETNATVGDYLVISIDGELSTWFLLENTGPCNNPFNDFGIDDTFPTPCPCECYEITGTFKQVKYLDCDGVLQTVVGPGPLQKFCSQTYPSVSGIVNNYQIINNGACIDGECPLVCYELENCDTGQILYSTLQSLFQYVNTNTVVEIVGYDGCWSVRDSEELCDCPISPIVVREYGSCGECLPIIAYKLTGCENPDDIKYTYQDLSLFVGEYVKVEDCGCFFVELIDFQPPSITTVVILTSFSSCPACLTQYYILEDCNNLLDPIYTGTNLSTYLDDIVNVQGCEGCWEISEVEIPINPVAVTITNTYIDCPSCTPVLPCMCNKMTNFSTQNKEYEYIDCNDQTVVLTLGAGETSGKICLKVWTIDYPDTDTLEIFGECESTNTVGVYTCPIVVPKRKIKPGYSVPTCDIDKWEKITCRASEILYKEVMRLRYGLSNCCPEDDEKWLIKKELIDLAALIDPDYVCAPTQSCGCPPSSCGCGCNSTLKTCNSQ